eukprot:6700076-Pyramimonas_sp.AAC.1
MSAGASIQGAPGGSTPGPLEDVPGSAQPLVVGEAGHVEGLRWLRLGAWQLQKSKVKPKPAIVRRVVCQGSVLLGGGAKRRAG